MSSDGLRQRKWRRKRPGADLRGVLLATLVEVGRAPVLGLLPGITSSQLVGDPALDGADVGTLRGGAGSTAEETGTDGSATAAARKTFTGCSNAKVGMI